MYNKASVAQNKTKRFSPIWIAVIIGLLIILGLLAAWWFLWRDTEDIRPVQNDQIVTQAVIEEQPAAEPVRRPDPEPEPEPVVIREPEPPPAPVIIAAPAEPPPPVQQVTVRRRPPPPVASYNVPAVIPPGGVEYRIRWGDTLWDIADAFYRNPWLYTRIARHNNIRNPNHIISGTVIRIPPRN